MSARFSAAMKTRDGVWLILYALLFISSLVSQPSLAVDTISVNESISGDQVIVSQREVFKLGFFRPGKPSSSKYYLGIWYNKVSVQTVVWVANRDAPISDRFSSELRFDNGNLVLFNESKAPVWSTNLTSTPLGSLRATIQDDGNFVFKDGTNSSKPLWQSFDFPTDTCFPGSNMKLPGLVSRSEAVANNRVCESLCLQNCSCSAYSYEDGKCDIWIGGLMDMRRQLQSNSSAEPMNPRPAASEFSSSTKSRGLIIGIVAGSVVLFVIVFALLFLNFRTRIAWALGDRRG